MGIVGRVRRLGLTPFKGGAHRHPDVLDVEQTGPVGDRVFALVQRRDDGTLAVTRTVQTSALLGVRPSWDGATLRLVLPTGRVVEVRPGAVPEADAAQVTADYWGRAARLQLLPGPWDDVLSDLVGRQVRLGRAVAPREVVYAQAVTVVTTSSVAELARRAGSPVDDERFRSTVLLDTGDAVPFTEDGWVGRRLRLGEVEVEVTGAVPRCAVTRLEPGTGARLPDDPLRLLAADRTVGQEVVFGVGAEVLVPGQVAVGDIASVRP